MHAGTLVTARIDTEACAYTGAHARVRGNGRVSVAYSTLPYPTVLNSTLPYSTVPCSTLRHSTLSVRLVRSCTFDAVEMSKACNCRTELEEQVRPASTTCPHNMPRDVHTAARSLVSQLNQPHEDYH